MNDLTFAKATADEFRAFWEGQGWQFESGQGHCSASKGTKDGPAFCVEKHFKVGLGVYALNYLGSSDPGLWVCNSIKDTTTFGEALDILNELAATRAFGGWAVEEGNADGA